MRSLGCILVLLFISISSYSQSDLLFSNYNINTISRNPAAIENNGFVNAYLGIHQQWIGFEDAPNMQWAHVSNSFEKLNMGISLNVFNQSVGATLTQNIKIGYNYRIYFGGGHNLSFGLGAGLYFRRVDYTKLRFENNEQEIPVSIENKTLPDFDFGAEYNYNNITIGIASNHITVSNSNAALLKIPLQNHIYVDYNISLNKEIQIIPRMDFFNSGSITSLGLSLDFMYNNVFNAGIAYRNGTSLIIRTGFRISPVFEILYSYDMGSGTFTSYNAGVHEAILVARFKRKSQSHNSPRFID
jgi:type IX secretion system PorP/SprF family membrane protein